MFTGIIECFGEVEHIENHGSNIRFRISSPISKELKVDQSLAHDGVCLTVVELGDGWHVVDAIEETLQKSNLKTWKIGHLINLERAMLAGARLDGHMVQGHVDSIAECISRKDMDQSWMYTFRLPVASGGLLVNKGSVTINGISLTLVDPDDLTFSVAIIPYTFEHTNLKHINIGDTVNIEYDILGKYIQKGIAVHLASLK